MPSVDRETNMDIPTLPDAPIVTLLAASGTGKTRALRLWEESATRRDRSAPLWLDGEMTNGEISENLDQLPNSAAVLVDDVHRLDQSTVDEVIAAMQPGVGPVSQVVLAGRCDTRLPLARHRSSGLIVELTDAELRLSDLTIDALATERDVTLDVGDARAIERATEGWALAVFEMLSALRARSKASRASIDTATEAAADGLRARFVGVLPETTTRLFTESSMLTTLTGAACSHVTGIEDLGAAISEAHQAGIPISPLDRNDTSFRMHGLLRRGLYRHLIETTSAERVHELEMRAAEWALNASDYHAAIQHALAGGRPEAAADALGAAWQAHRAKITRDDVALFDGHALDDYAPFVLTRALVLADDGDGPAAAEALGALQELRWTGPLPQGYASLDSALLDLERMIPRPIATPSAEKMRRVVYRDEVGTDGPLELVQRFTVAFDRYSVAELDAARAECIEILQGHLAIGRTEGAEQHATVLACDLLALIDFDDGNQVDAEQHFDHANHLLIDTYGIGALHFRGAQVHDLVDAVLRPDSDQKAELLERIHEAAVDTGPRFHALIELCRLHDRRGDEVRALAALEQAEALASDVVPEPLYVDRLRRLRIAVDVSARPDRVVGGITAGERAVLKLLPSELTQTDISDQLGLSVNTVKSHLRSIYQKLGVSSRPEAVEYGIDVGLLCTVVPWNATATGSST